MQVCLTRTMRVISPAQATHLHHIQKMVKSSSSLSIFLLCLLSAHCMVTHPSVTRYQDGDTIVGQDGSGRTIYESSEIGQEIQQKQNLSPQSRMTSSMAEEAKKLPTINAKDKKSFTSFHDTSLLTRKDNKIFQGQTNPRQEKGISIIPHTNIKSLKELSDMIFRRFNKAFESVPGSQSIRKFTSTWGLYFLTLYIFTRDQPFFTLSKQQKKMAMLLFERARRRLNA